MRSQWQKQVLGSRESVEVEERLDPKPRVGEVWDARLPWESGYPYDAVL